jgi:hypothetical protein
MAIASIQEWLSGKHDYTRGVELCRQYSNNEALLDMLEEGPDTYNRQQLVKELQRIYESSPPETKSLPPTIEALNEIFPESSFTTFSEPKIEKWDTRDFTQEIKKRSVLAGSLTREINFLRSRLELFPTRQERFEAAKTIEEKRKVRQRIFFEIDYFQQNKKLPEEPAESKEKPIADMTPVEMMREYQLLAPRISKSKSKPEKHKYLLERREQLKIKLGL